MKIGLLIVLLLAVVHLNPPVQTELTITAVNKLNVARQNETIELTTGDLASLAEKDLTKLHVRDTSGKELLAQSMDTDYDDYRKPDYACRRQTEPPRCSQAGKKHVTRFLLGFAWDRAGKITSAEEWNKYVERFC